MPNGNDIFFPSVLFSLQVFDKSGLRVEFTPTKPDPSNLSKSTIKISFTNTSSEVSCKMSKPNEPGAVHQHSNETSSAIKAKRSECPSRTLEGWVSPETMLKDERIN